MTAALVVAVTSTLAYGTAVLGECKWLVVTNTLAYNTEIFD